MAHDGDELVGCVLAAADGAAFWPGFARDEALRLAPVVARRALADHELRARLAQRLRLRPRRRRGRLAPPAVTPARLLSIGVREDRRGEGIAELLVDELCAAMRRDAIAHVGLSVRAENERALAFYERSGWERERSEPGAVYLRRATRG